MISESNAYQKAYSPTIIENEININHLLESHVRTNILPLIFKELEGKYVTINRFDESNNLFLFIENGNNEIVFEYSTEKNNFNFEYNSSESLTFKTTLQEYELPMFLVKAFKIKC